MVQEPAERLQKRLAQLGLASRRAAEEWIRAGRVSVNGQPAALGMRVRGSDQIRLDGRLVRRRPAAAQQVFLVHRSPGETLRGAQLLERLPRIAGRRFVTVSPMPGVDGGLELVTSDGEIAQQLQRCVRALHGEFSVRVRGQLDEAQLQGIRAGVADRGVRLEVIACESAGGEAANRWYTLSVRGASGKEVRQLFERQAVIVSRVLRTRLGPVALDRSLARGRFRPLTAAEVQALLARADDV